MARHYSPRDFLRRAPNALLAEYFHKKDLLLELDFASFKERDIEPVFLAWQALPAAGMAAVDSDFRMVDEIADEPGTKILLDQAANFGVNLLDAFKDLPGFHHKALWALMEHREFVEVASRIHEADQLSNTYWNRRREIEVNALARDDDDARSELANALVVYFSRTEGRGQHCVVEHYALDGRAYFFAFPEDYGRMEMEYAEGGVLQPRPLRPAFQVVFVYDPSVPAFDTYFHGPKSTRDELEQIFAALILKTKVKLSKDERVYNLDLFKSRPKFVFGPSSGIQDVHVKLLRLSLLGANKRKITLEVDPNQAKDAIYDLLGATFAPEAPDGGRPLLPLALAHVTRVGIEAVFAPGGRRGKRTKTFYLGHPSSCSLRHEGRDAALRQMLIDSKVEPAAAAAPAAAKK